MTAVQIKPVRHDDAPLDSTMTHYVCCDRRGETTAFCGTLTTVDYDDMTPVDCVVCNEIADEADATGLCPHNGVQCPPTKFTGDQ